MAKPAHLFLGREQMEHNNILYNIQESVIPLKFIPLNKKITLLSLPLIKRTTNFM